VPGECENTPEIYRIQGHPRVPPSKAQTKPRLPRRKYKDLSKKSNGRLKTPQSTKTQEVLRRHGYRPTHPSASTRRRKGRHQPSGPSVGRCYEKTKGRYKESYGLYKRLLRLYRKMDQTTAPHSNARPRRRVRFTKNGQGHKRLQKSA